MVRSQCECNDKTDRPAARGVTKVLLKGLIDAGWSDYARDTVCVTIDRCLYTYVISLPIRVVALCWKQGPLLGIGSCCLSQIDAGM